MPRGRKHLAGNDDFDEYDDGYDEYYDDEEDYATSSGDPGNVPIQVATKKDNLWRCTVCTLDNAEDSTSCDICGALRYPISPSSKSVPAAKKPNEVGVSASKTKVTQQRNVPEKSLKAKQNGLDASGIHNPEAELMEKIKELDINTAKRKPKIDSGPPLDSYEPEDWMLETLKQEHKQLLHLAIARCRRRRCTSTKKRQSKLAKGHFHMLDESAEERARGITMTVAVAQFETPKFQIVVLDSPGHRDFVPNMISAASQADAAVVVVDASTGAFEAGMEGEGQGVGQTKEHTQLVRSFGVEQIVVAGNKMDAVGYSEDRFNAIKATLRPFFRHCGFKDSGFRWIPLSAMENENMVAQPANEELKLWYRGPSLNFLCVDPACLLQGGVLCHPEYPVPAASLFEAKVLILETSGPLLRGSQVLVHCHHAKEPAKVTKLVSFLDQKGEAIPNRKPRVLLANQRAIIEIQPERGLCVEEYTRYKALGRITLRDAGKTLAVGIVMPIAEQ
ncbi:hypothetical protein L7F22_035180 [Adiantum nelumboides]|nr:hypothetical protein [Adiantum nelumboides]